MVKGHPRWLPQQAIPHTIPWADVIKSKYGRQIPTMKHKTFYEKFMEDPLYSPHTDTEWEEYIENKWRQIRNEG